MPDTDTADTGTRSRRTLPSYRRAGRVLWLSAGAGGLVWAIVGGWPQLRMAAGILRSADPVRLSLAVACQVAALALLAVAYRAALSTAGARVALRQAGGVALRAGAVSRLLPGGGAAAALFAIRRLRCAGVSDGPAVAGVALHGIVTMATLVALVAAVAAVGTSAAGGTIVVIAGVLAGAVAAVAGGAAVAARRRLALVAARLRTRPSLQVWGAAVDTLAAGPLPVRPLGAAVACAVAAWTCELAGLWLAVAAVTEPLPIAAVALGLGAANAVTAMPHTPGGVGVVEVTMTAAFVAAGLDASAALGGVLAYRAVGFWFPVALGTALLVTDGVPRPSAWRREAAPVPG